VVGSEIWLSDELPSELDTSGVFSAPPDGVDVTAVAGGVLPGPPETGELEPDDPLPRLEPPPEVEPPETGTVGPVDEPAPVCDLESSEPSSPLDVVEEPEVTPEVEDVE
jgi:hypothetical protein